MTDKLPVVPNTAKARAAARAQNAATLPLIREHGKLWLTAEPLP